MKCQMCTGIFELLEHILTVEGGERVAGTTGVNVDVLRSSEGSVLLFICDSLGSFRRLSLFLFQVAQVFLEISQVPRMQSLFGCGRFCKMVLP